MALSNAERQRRHRAKCKALRPAAPRKRKEMRLEDLDRETAKYRRTIEERTLYAIWPLVYYLQNPGVTEIKLSNLVNYALENIGEYKHETVTATLPNIVLKPILSLLITEKESAMIITNLGKLCLENE